MPAVWTGHHRSLFIFFLCCFHSAYPVIVMDKPSDGNRMKSRLGVSTVNIRVGSLYRRLVTNALSKNLVVSQLGNIWLEQGCHKVLGELVPLPH